MTLDEFHPDTTHNPETPAHDGKITHRYLIHYPEHEPRESDPHYKDFHEYRRKTKANAKCAIGQHRNDYSECIGELSLHHSHIEFALTNGVDLSWLEIDYPGVSDPDTVGAWVESGANLMWLCTAHHLGPGGIHCASSADFEAAKYIRGLIKGINDVAFGD